MAASPLSDSLQTLSSDFSSIGVLWDWKLFYLC